MTKPPKTIGRFDYGNGEIRYTEEDGLQIVGATSYTRTDLYEAALAQRDQAIKLTEKAQDRFLRLDQKHDVALARVAELEGRIGEEIYECQLNIKRATSRDRKQYLRGRIEAVKDLRATLKGDSE